MSLHNNQSGFRGKGRAQRTGDGTALYISSLLKPIGVKITRLARGLAAGSTIGYATGKTLTDAITGRQELE
ncbi:MAG: hypothetical protein ACYTFW_20705 [Planctomycetota bacterium]